LTSQTAAIHALHAHRLALFRAVILNAPDIAPEIATALAVPFERMPFFGVRVVRKHEALELKTAEILEMDRLNILGGLAYILHHPLLLMGSDAVPRC
jgi:hypothetical protein